MKDFIYEQVQEYMNEFSADSETGWRRPLVGYADAEDPLFVKLQGIISPEHSLPGEIVAGARTVISYFIPFSVEVVESNIEDRGASKMWAVAYGETNNLISGLGSLIENMIEKEGFKAVSLPPTHNFDEEELISYWSHRHVAYIAGLGKFGINNMLITDRGCCGRIGSVVTDMNFAVTERGETENCLNKIDGSCRLCVERCVGNVFAGGEFARQDCYDICRANNRRYPELKSATVCGKCLVGLPCSTINPAKEQ